MAFRAMMPPRFVWPVDVTNGNTTTTSSPTAISTRRLIRTDGTVEQLLGNRRAAPRWPARRWPTSSPPRSDLRCWRSSPAAMRTRRPKSTSALSLSSENRVAWVTTEMATAAKTVVGRLRIRPTTAAASAGSRTPGANPAAAPGCVRAPVRVHAGPGQHPGQTPHQGREPADADAEQGGPLGVLGHGPHRHAGAGEAEEGGQRRAGAGSPPRWRRPRGSRSGPGSRRPGSGSRRRAAGRGSTCRPACRSIDERVGVGEERQPGDDAGRVCDRNPATTIVTTVSTSRGAWKNRRTRDRSSGHADQRRRAEPEHEGDRERHLGVLHEVERQDGAGRADGRLGEVDDPQRAVDEDDAGGGEGVDQAEDEAPEEDGARRPPPGAAGAGQEELGVEGDGHDRQRPAHGAAAGARRVSTLCGPGHLARPVGQRRRGFSWPSDSVDVGGALRAWWCGSPR